MNDIDKIQPSFYKYNIETDEFIAGNEAKYRPNMHLGVIMDQSPDYIKDNAFSGVDVYALAALSLAGVKHNREEIKELQSKISDFGSTKLNSNEIWIQFDSEFSSKLNGQIPVVTLSSNQPNTNLSIIEKTSTGFKVVSSNSNVIIDWIAMAKVNSSQSQEVESKVDPTLLQGLRVDPAKQVLVKDFFEKNAAENKKQLEKK